MVRGKENVIIDEDDGGARAEIAENENAVSESAVSRDVEAEAALSAEIDDEKNVDGEERGEGEAEAYDDDGEDGEDGDDDEDDEDGEYDEDDEDDEEDEDMDDEYDEDEEEYEFSVGQVKGDTLRIFVVLFGLGLFLTYGFSYLNASNASEMYLGNVKYSFQFFGVLAVFVMIATLLESMYARRRYRSFFRNDSKKLAFELITGLQFFLTIGILGGGIAVLTYVLTAQ